MTELNHSLLFAQDGNGAASPIIVIMFLAMTVLTFAGIWQTFVKAGAPGWGAIVPIYNAILLLEIAGRPIWWIFLLLVPFVNLVIGIIVAIDVAKNFGKGEGFGLGLAFLGFIFYPILGFGSARYEPTS
ncbi:MAG: DUF5684 domain-containing protein [Planctomycetota bacterium]|jgi:hypothetical protein